MAKLSYKTSPLEYTVTEINPNDENTVRTGSAPAEYCDEPIPLDKLSIYSEGPIELATYSPGHPSGELKIVTMGWGGDFRTSIARLELSQIAEANPGTTIAVVNNPGVGASAPIPKSSIKQMIRTGSFEPYGEILARHLAPTAGDYDSVSGAGHSMGARSIISLAPRLDNFDYLTATDPPGSRRLGLFGVANAFMIVEGRHSAEYKANTDNTAGLREQKAYDDGGFTNYLKSMSLPALWQFLISQPRAMGRSGLEGDLDTLAQTNKVGAVQITSPEMSALNSPRSVFEIMGRAATSGTRTKFQQVLLPGQTHSVVAGGNAHVTGILSKML